MSVSRDETTGVHTDVSRPNGVFRMSKTDKQWRVVDGKLILATVCAPGRVRAGLSLTKARYTSRRVAGANHIGTERGTKVPFVAIEEEVK